MLEEVFHCSPWGTMPGQICVLEQVELVQFKGTAARGEHTVMNWPQPMGFFTSFYPSYYFDEGKYKSGWVAIW